MYQYSIITIFFFKSIKHYYNILMFSRVNISIFKLLDLFLIFFIPMKHYLKTKIHQDPNIWLILYQIIPIHLLSVKSAFKVSLIYLQPIQKNCSEILQPFRKNCRILRKMFLSSVFPQLENCGRMLQNSNYQLGTSPFFALADLQLDSDTYTKSFICNTLTYLIQSTQHIYDTVLAK